MNLSDSSCSSFSVTDSESDKETNIYDDCDNKRDNFDNENICAKNTSRKDDTRKDTNSAMKSEKSVEKDDIKKTENTIDEKKSVGEEVCQINKEEIVFR